MNLGSKLGVDHTFDLPKVHAFQVNNDLNKTTTLKRCYVIKEQPQRPIRYDNCGCIETL